MPSFHTGEARPPAPATDDSIPRSASRTGIDTSRTLAAVETPSYQQCHWLRDPSVLTSRTPFFKTLRSQDHRWWPRLLAPAGPRTREDSEPRVRPSRRAPANSKFGKNHQGWPMGLWIPVPSGPRSKSLWFLTTASLAGAGDEASAGGMKERNLPSSITNACQNVVTIPLYESFVTASLYRYLKMKRLRANVRVSPNGMCG